MTLQKNSEKGGSLVKDSGGIFVLWGMGPNTLTDWHLDAQDGPDGRLVVRIIGTSGGREVVTPPICRRLTNWRVQDVLGRVRRLQRSRNFKAF